MNQFHVWKRAAAAASLLLAAFGSGAAWAQGEANSEPLRVNAPEVAVTYSPERGQVANLGCKCFWMQGGSVEGALPVYRALSIAGSFSGEHASKFQPGVGLSQLSYLAGPRYTLGVPRYRSRIFGEALFGAAHAYNGLFPSGSGSRSTATAFAMQTGGGVDFDTAGPLAIRLIKISYVRGSLPNNGSDTQNDLRLEFGAAYRFGKR